MAFTLATGADLAGLGGAGIQKAYWQGKQVWPIWECTESPLIRITENDYGAFDYEYKLTIADQSLYRPASLILAGEPEDWWFRGRLGQYQEARTGSYSRVIVNSAGQKNIRTDGGMVNVTGELYMDDYESYTVPRAPGYLKLDTPFYIAT